MHDLIVIGSGPAGYVAAIRAAQLGLSVACTEKHSRLGGTCLNVGCIPSKALLHSSLLYHEIISDAKKHGIEVGNVTLHLDQMMKRKDEVVSQFNQGLEFLFKKNKIERLIGQAKFIDSNTLEINGKNYQAKNFIIASGSEPIGLPFLPFDEEKILSSTGALSLKEVPSTLAVIGGGVIGLELGSVYARLGSKVEVIELQDRIIPEFDSSLSKAFEKVLKEQGLSFHLKTKLTSSSSSEKGIHLRIDQEGKEHELIADKVLVSIGRRPVTHDLNLEAIGINTDPRGFIPIDANFRTRHPHIFAIGDVAGAPMLAHKGSHEGICCAEIIANQRPQMNYAAVPNIIYTHPEVASVGLTEEMAKEANLNYKKGEFPFAVNSRALATGTANHGFVKVLIHADTNRILGCHMMGPSVSDIIMEATIAIQNNLTANDLIHSIHGHPTYSEALHEALLSATTGSIHK